MSPSPFLRDHAARAVLGDDAGQVDRLVRHTRDLMTVTAGRDPAAVATVLDSVDDSAALVRLLAELLVAGFRADHFGELLPPEPELPDPRLQGWTP
jgi:hypothetical protein